MMIKNSIKIKIVFLLVLTLLWNGVGMVFAGKTDIEITAANDVILPEGFDNIDVSLPTNLDFHIVLLKDQYTGIVTSNDFVIANNGADSCVVALKSVVLTVDSQDQFDISPTRSLPETGNNLYIELVCPDLREGKDDYSVVLSESPVDVEHIFNLDAHSSATFRFDGSANEFGDVAWSQANVRVTALFRVYPQQYLLD